MTLTPNRYTLSFQMMSVKLAWLEKPLKWLKVGLPWMSVLEKTVVERCIQLGQHDEIKLTRLLGYWNKAGQVVFLAVFVG